MNIKKLANSIIAVVALTLTCGVTNAADSIDTSEIHFLIPGGPGGGCG